MNLQQARKAWTIQFETDSALLGKFTVRVKIASPCCDSMTDALGRTYWYTAPKKTDIEVYRVENGLEVYCGPLADQSPRIQEEAIAAYRASWPKKD